MTKSKTLLIVSGINNLLLALFLAGEKTVEVVYIQVVDGTKNFAEEELVKKLLELSTTASLLEIISTEIDQKYDETGKKSYSYSLPHFQIDYGQYNFIYASSNIIIHIENNLKENIKVDCIAEGGSIVINTNTKNSVNGFVLHKLKYFWRKLKNQILEKSVTIENIHLFPSFDNALIRTFTCKNYFLGYVDQFSSIDLFEYRNWSRKLVRKAGIQLDFNEQYTWFHLTNKRISLDGYRDWLLQGKPEDELIIKVHPSDDRDFQSIFPKSKVIHSERDRLIPAELYVLENLCYVGWYSTYLYMHDPTKVFLIKVNDPIYLNYSRRRFAKLCEIMDLVNV